MKPAPMDSDDKKWQIESDLRAMATAEEIKKDPKRMAAVKALAKEKMDEMAKIAK